MSTYILIFAAALVATLSLTPAARWLALRTGIVDNPNARKLHRNAVPLLGGLAMYVAFMAVLLIFNDRFNFQQLVGILLGASLVSFFGIWDDSRGLRPLVKLLGQAAAAVVLILSGVQVSLFGNPAWPDIALTIFWIVGITNAFNLLDNMDGLSGGIAAVSAAFFLVLAGTSGQFLVAGLAAAILGAALGFLRYNFNPASIFMGDTGSLFLGFMLAALGIKLRFENTTLVTWMIPILVLAIPILDTTLVTISRARRGLNPFTSPGKDHISHRLVAMGMTHREAVMTLYLACGALGLSAIFLSKASVMEAYLIGGAVIVIAIAAL
ncbi:MAG: undecaprenyl/decaprenyl-phosphate alpha-N-acetylglucosaminyl 1-phosphate transferase, partial [Chloroflexota bacterium]